MKRLPIASVFLLFILLCMSAAYWGLQMFKPPLRTVAAPVQERPEAPLSAAAGLFGGQLGGMAVASNYSLKGVVVANTQEDSIAIIAAEGKPTQSVRVNKEFLPGVVVKEVHKLYVMLSEGGMSKRVDLPDAAKGARVDVGASPVPVGQQVAPQPNVGMSPPQPMPQPQPMPVQSMQPMQPPQPMQPNLGGNPGGNPNSQPPPPPPQ